MTCEKCGQVHKPTIGGRPCKGHKKSYLDQDGERIFYPEAERPGCTRAAMLGQDVCHSHGGATKQNRAAGKARETERRAAVIMARFAGPVPTTPSAGLLDSIAWLNGYVIFLRAQVTRTINDAENTDDLIWGKTKTVEGDVVVGNGPTASLERATTTTEEAVASAWDALLSKWQKELDRLCIEAIRIGIEERRVRMAEQDGARVADVITKTSEGVLAALVAAGLPDAMVEVFRQTLATEAPRHLRLLTG